MNPAVLIAAAWAGGAIWLRRRAQRLDDWRDLAHRLDLPFRDLGKDGLEIELRELPRPIRVERQANATRLWTTYPVAGGPRFRLIPKRHRPAHFDPAALERHFGPTTWLRVSPRFDRNFWTFTREREGALAVLSGQHPALPDALIDEAHGLSLTSARRVIELDLPDPQPSKYGAHAALLSVAEIASRDIFGLGALRTLPGAKIEHEPTSLEDSGTPIVSITEPRRVCFRPQACADGVRTEAFVDSSPAAPFAAKIENGGRLVGALPRGSIPIEAVAELSKVGTCELSRSSDRLTLRWPAIVTESAVLGAGARLLCGLTPR